MDYLSSNELVFHNHDAGFEVAKKLLDEDYVVLFSYEEDLLILNYEWVGSESWGGRNGVVFRNREQFDMELEDYLSGADLGEEEDYEEPREIFHPADPLDAPFVMDIQRYYDELSTDLMSAQQGEATEEIPFDDGWYLDESGNRTDPLTGQLSDVVDHMGRGVKYVVWYMGCLTV